MKKRIVALMLALAALAAFTTGVAFAQAPQPTGSGRGLGLQGRTAEPLYTYMTDALSQALAISPADFESRRAAGQTAYQVALSLGIPADQIPALLAKARMQAINAALADKVITQQQADWMRLHTTRMGTRLCNGTAQVLGAGMLARRGPRWQQITP